MNGWWKVPVYTLCASIPLLGLVVIEDLFGGVFLGGFIAGIGFMLALMFTGVVKTVESGQ
ncbi:MAG: hypothetical protein V3W06_04765 [Acidimicrobiia bacterium]